MKTDRKVAAKPRPVVISSLAAKLLGHCRTVTATPTTRYLSTAFPAFNGQELSNAMGEPVDKHLMAQKGHDEHTTYTLTDYGREGRVSIA